MGIFWGNRKLFSKSDGGVRRAMNHPLLRGQPHIGRGAYSVVLGDERSVFKLTIDRSAHALAGHQSGWQCPALPEILRLHGQVGELDCGIPLFLIEMEALARLENGSDARKRCLSVARQLRFRSHDMRTPLERLQQVADNQPDDAMGKGLRLLAEFLAPRWPEFHLDLHIANFMRRTTTGEPVIADPFMDMATREQALANYASTLPEGTVIL